MILRASGLLVPGLEGGGGLEGRGKVGGEVREESQAGHALDIGDRSKVEVHSVVLAIVGADEGERGGRLAEADDDLVESVGDSNLRLADSSAAIGREDRAGDNINHVESSSPAAASHLDLVPVATVERTILRADVGHRERLVHSDRVPLIVAGGADMTTGEAERLKIVVVGWSRARGWEVEFLMPGVVRHTLDRAISLIGSQDPGDPDGAMRLIGIRDSIGRFGKRRQSGIVWRVGESRNGQSDAVPRLGQV